MQRRGDVETSKTVRNDFSSYDIQEDNAYDQKVGKVELMGC